MAERTGEYVVYGGTEICCIESIVSRCFDGENVLEYCRLVPVDPCGTVIYVQADMLESRVRSLYSREEIMAVIDTISVSDDEWISDRSLRRAHFNAVLHSNDYGSILSMVKAILREKESREHTGRHLMSFDKIALESARRLIRWEFGFVLGIGAHAVDELIEDRLVRQEFGK